MILVIEDKASNYRQVFPRVYDGRPLWDYMYHGKHFCRPSENWFVYDDAGNLLASGDRKTPIGRKPRNSQLR